MEVSVVVLTKRPGGLDILVDSLLRQTGWSELVDGNHVELILVDERAADPRRQAAVERVRDQLGLGRGRLQHRVPPDYTPPRYSKLMRATNVGLQAASGTWLVWLSDYVCLLPTALDYCLRLASVLGPAACISGRVHQVGALPSSVQLRPLTDDRSYSLFTEDFRLDTLAGLPLPLSWQDERPAQFSRSPAAWEGQCAVIPRALIQEHLPLDETFDDGYHYNNQVLALAGLTHTPESVIVVPPALVGFELPHRLYLPEPAEHQAKCVANQARFAGLLAAVTGAS